MATQGVSEVGELVPDADGAQGEDAGAGVTEGGGVPEDGTHVTVAGEGSLSPVPAVGEEREAPGGPLGDWWTWCRVSPTDSTRPRGFGMRSAVPWWRKKRRLAASEVGI